MAILRILLLVVVTTSSAWAGCTISKDVKGTSTVVFTLSPTPTEVINQLGMSNMLSPVALIDKLQSYSDTANSLMKTVTDKMKALNPFGSLLPIPECRYYWISNQLFCDNVNSAIIAPICGMFTTITNVTNPISLPLPQLDSIPLTCENDLDGRPWGLEKIQAPETWALGYNGTGVVVANIDTGVRYTHVELRDNMRPFFNWFDPYNFSTNVPSDTNGHGSHTMGTMVGKNVGVAPGATWIACRGCGTASCDNEQLLACGQFLSCPDNKTQSCSTRPDVINNSWGGGIGNTFYLGVLSVWKAMGISFFFSSGNSGPACSTVMSPADSNYTKYGHLSVGSTACNDKIASYSSTGPSQAADYMAGLGVQIVVPGSNVRSAWNTSDTAYNTISGTSMASPHSTGAGAVILSKNKALTPEQVYAAMMSTAYRDPAITNSAAYCTSSSADLSGYPNNVYGYGRVNLLEAVKVV